jgi:glutaredoxin
MTEENVKQELEDHAEHEQKGEKHYVLITKDSCPYCNKAIDLLKEKSLSFIYTDMENAPKALDSTKEQLSWRTVPMIWKQDIDWEDGVGRVLDNVFIGGLEQLEGHFEEDLEDD